jgi:hypothetical protein
MLLYGFGALALVLMASTSFLVIQHRRQQARVRKPRG